MAQVVKRLPAMRETRVRSLDREDPLEKGMAAHSSILAWRIPWTERSLVGYGPRGRKESDTTERLHPTLITMYTAMQLTKTRASETLGIFALQSFYSKFMQEKKCLVSKCRSWLPRKLILIEMDKTIV